MIENSEFSHYWVPGISKLHSVIYEQSEACYLFLGSKKLAFVEYDQGMGTRLPAGKEVTLGHRPPVTRRDWLKRCYTPLAIAYICVQCTFSDKTDKTNNQKSDSQNFRSTEDIYRQFAFRVGC
jgi:hypothetical protein